ncbi:MAG: ATP-binding protein [Pseudomonadota bacterium]
MDTGTLKRIITEQTRLFSDKKDLVDRLTYISPGLIAAREILVITGVRRCGKSSFMKILKDKHFSNEPFFYINFEDERLVEFTHKDFNKILEAVYELTPDKFENKKIYLLIDEIQNIKYFEKWLNRMYEDPKFKIIVSGSNATLLSSEIATALTGRNFSIILYPFSFKEFLLFKGKSIDLKDAITTKESSGYKRLLIDYLNGSGFPEVIKTQEPELLAQYYTDIIYKDIVVRHKIKNVQEFREFTKYLFSNTCSFLSYNQISKTFEGISSPNTVKNYLEWLKNSFLFFTLARFSASFKKQLKHLPKVYSIDHGLNKKIGFSISDDHSKLYENTVFLELLRRRKDFYYFITPSGKEIDFVVKEKGRKVCLVQVCYDVSAQKTVEREETSLIEGMKHFNTNVGYIINSEVDKEKAAGNNLKIVYMPLWKWLMQEDKALTS